MIFALYSRTVTIFCIAQNTKHYDTRSGNGLSCGVLA